MPSWAIYGNERRMGPGPASVTAAQSYTGPGNIVAGATAWYGLRAYSSAQCSGTTKAIRIVKTSDGTAAQDINILSTGALDVATINALGYGVSVTTFYDQSGAGLDLTQATLATMPTLNLSGIGSLPTVQFNGSQGLSNSTGFTVTGQPGTISSVAVHTGAGYGTIIGSAAEALFTNFGNDITTYTGATINHIAAADSVWHAFQNIADDAGGGSFIYVNGSSSAASTGNSNFATTIIRMGTGTGALTGGVTEGGFWLSAFNATQAGNMNTNQRAYYGI